MAELAEKIKNSLDEARLLILVVQVLLGFQLRAPFEDRFANLSGGFQGAHIIALALLLAAFVLFVAPAPYLEVAFGGETSTRVQSFTSVMLSTGLAAFMAALAINAYVLVTFVVSAPAAAAVTAVFVIASTWWWYALPT